MARWREPLRTKVNACPTAEDLDYQSIRKSYVEHETDVVVAGYEHGEWFYPECNVIRHYVDGVLVKSDKFPLNPGEDKPLLLWPRSTLRMEAKETPTE